MKSLILAADDVSTNTAQAKQRSEMVRDCAVMVAKAFKTSIELVNVADLTMADLTDFGSYDSFVELVKEQKQKRLDELSVSTDVQIENRLIRGMAVPTLSKLLKDDKRYECAVMGTQGRKGVGRVILGSVAEEVVRNAKIPVFVIGPKVSRKSIGPKKKISKILVPTDLGPNSKKAEEYALRLAKIFRADVVFVYCVYEGLHSVLQTAMAAPRAESKFRQLLTDLKRDVSLKLTKKKTHFGNSGIKSSFVISEGKRPASDLLTVEVKRSGADLIVMGTHGRNLFGQAFFGSTARQLILNSPLPVVAIKSK